MKTHPADSRATNLGPFINLVLILGEQRARIENEASRGATASAALPLAAINDVIEQVANHEQPVFRRPTILGPFLAMVLTLGKRKAAEPTPWLCSSTVPASPR